MRHGQDNNTVRGGWSNSLLTDLGVQQSKKLANELLKNKNEYNIGIIYSSDLPRAKQTAEIIANKLDLPIEFLSSFREVNNGNLAGMDNIIADKLYPNLYWRNLSWDEHYPNGESPKEFYERIIKAWEILIQSISSYDKNVLIVTHGGVINVIKCITDETEYSNKQKYQGISSAKISMEIEV